MSTYEGRLRQIAAGVGYAASTTSGLESGVRVHAPAAAGITS
ncbi:MAG: hypothetical protein WCA85_11275 [Paraburkholderia sp.]